MAMSNAHGVEGMLTSGRISPWSETSIKMTKNRPDLDGFAGHLNAALSIVAPNA